MFIAREKNSIVEIIKLSLPSSHALITSIIVQINAIKDNTKPNIFIYSLLLNNASTNALCREDREMICLTAQSWHRMTILGSYSVHFTAYTTRLIVPFTLFNFWGYNRLHYPPYIKHSWVMSLWGGEKLIYSPSNTRFAPWLY